MIFKVRKRDWDESVTLHIASIILWKIVNANIMTWCPTCSSNIPPSFKTNWILCRRSTKREYNSHFSILSYLNIIERSHTTLFFIKLIRWQVIWHKGPTSYCTSSAVCKGRSPGCPDGTWLTVRLCRWLQVRIRVTPPRPKMAIEF